MQVYNLFKAPDNKPPFDTTQLADLMAYHEIYAREEQPQWRKDVIKEHGPAGTSYDNYNDYASAALWEWNWRAFGDIPIDKDGEVIFDGRHFRQLQEDGSRRKIKLEDWLIDSLVKKNPNEFDDGKWKYKKIWYELIRIMEVSLSRIIASLSNYMNGE